MPTLKPCPHCGREVGDWHREWYARENQVELFNHRAAADCPYGDCRGGVDLYADKDGVFAADPALRILHRSRTQAIKWARGDAGFANYIQNDSTGQLYVNYPFEP